MATKQIVAAGTQIITIRRAGTACANFRVGNTTFSRPLWTMAIYEARSRADGVMTWRLLRSFGPDVSGTEPSARMISAAMDEAARRGLRYESGIRHGMRAVTVAA